MRIRYSTEENGRLVKKAVVYTRDEHGINFADVDSEAVGIVGRLKSAGYETYIVGGAVRDLIIGKKPKDFDIVTEASPGRIKKIFRNARVIGHRFRLVHVYFGPKIFEVSTFRSLKDGHTSNTFGTIEDDVLRRDFTLNALFYDPLKQIVVDYVEGMKAIREKKIKPIIPLAAIFRDDPVRMIRAVKYGAGAGFSLPFSLKWKIKKQSMLLSSVSPSRLTEEIFKILHSSQAAAIVEALEANGLFKYLQPAASRLMKENRGFCSRYLNTMGFLNQSGFKNLPGEALSALIKDYLDDEVDWAADTAENYKNTFSMACAFMLPMNPPKAELDHAVRLIFAAHGITVKRSRFNERGRSARPGEEGEAAPVPSDETRRRRKHRRRRRARTEPSGSGAPPLF